MKNNTLFKETEIIQFCKYEFSGGIHPEQHKTISNQSDIEDFPLAKELLLPVYQSKQSRRENLVSPGELVLFGQKLFDQEQLVQDYEAPKTATHSPCYGEVLEIGPRDFGHSTGLSMLSARIKTTSDEKSPTFPTIKNWQLSDRQDLLNRVEEAAIVGLGGAVFPTHLKLAKQGKSIDTLIVNAMECEPYITCDDRLLQEFATEVLQGALIAAKIVNASTILFGIEENKPEAIKLLQQVILDFIENDPINTTINIKIIIAPTKYPSGGEKQLIQLLTGKQVPQGKYPASLGILVQNVATLYAVYQAVAKGLPLTHRVVTITGDLVKKPANYWMAFGTPISHIISILKIETSRLRNVIIGGPLMGQSISNLEIPTQKATNCLIFNADQNNLSDSKQSIVSSHLACIRCGECEVSCPIQLLPQQLYWFAQSEQWNSLEEYSLFDCIECGACSYVCPSEIPLVSYYRFAKSQIKSKQMSQTKSDIAKQRFENRDARLVRIKQQRDEKRRKTAETRKLATENKKKDPDGKKAAIEAALARVKNKKDINS